eukprot:14673351-Alexandrium_andersonii.AAC.1
MVAARGAVGSGSICFFAFPALLTVRALPACRVGQVCMSSPVKVESESVSYTHLRAHETSAHL